MIWRLRIIAYPILLACAIWMGYQFVHHLNKQRSRAEVLLSNELAAGPSPAAVTNASASAQGAATTNLAAGTNGAAATNETAATRPTTGPGVGSAPAGSATPGSWIPYFIGFLGSLVLLGLLAAYDFSWFFAERFHTFLLDESADTEKHPEYEEAERLWADGRHLDAIQQMREFLREKPHAQYAAIRIAEIYEKDLGNFLAAALEYEEILKKRLPPERWGWMAIHLANLYSGKLGQTDKAEALLRQIVEQYPRSSAARKARERLGIPEPVEEPESEASEEDDEDEPPTTPLPPRPSNLPPGFRPK